MANFDKGFATFDRLSMHDDLVFDFGPSIGLWSLMNHSTWRLIHPFSPTLVVSGDLDGDKFQTADLICVFPGYGIYRTIGPAYWVPSPLHGMDPALMAVGELDGTAGRELLASFPGGGIWRYDDGVGWSALHPFDASKLLTADIDGDGKDDVIVEFPDWGMWAFMNRTTWTPIHAFKVAHIATGDLDGAGGTDLVVDFGANLGIWILRSGQTWTKLHHLPSEGLLLADLDGNGTDDVIVDFGGLGLWARMNGSRWELVHGLSPEAMTAGRFH
jgi:hypothetical protein